MRDILDVAFLDSVCIKTKTRCQTGEIAKGQNAPQGEAYLNPSSYVISNLKIPSGITKCLKLNTLLVLFRSFANAIDNATPCSLCSKGQPKVLYEKKRKNVRLRPGFFLSCSNPLHKPESTLAKLLVGEDVD